MRLNQRTKFQTRYNLKFRNKINNEITLGDLVNEEYIDGKTYFVIRNERGTFIKLSKEAYNIVK